MSGGAVLPGRSEAFAAPVYLRRRFAAFGFARRAVRRAGRPSRCQRGLHALLGRRDGRRPDGAEACLRGGGSVLIFPATELVYCPARKNVLYAAEGGFELGFSAQRALGRNRFIHAMGEKTLVAQTGFGKGGTWNGSLDNLQHEYSPLFVFDDGSEGVRALSRARRDPVQALTSLQALTPAQLSFDMQ